MKSRFFLKSCDDLFSVDRGEIDHDDRYAQKHIPVGVGDEVVEQLQKRIFGLDGIHIIDLNDITCPIHNFIFDAIAVQRHVDEVDDRINDERNADRGNDAFHISLDESEAEHKDGNAHFQ